MRKKLRDRERIDDASLLDLLLSGDLYVDLETAEVWKNGKLLVPSLVGTENKNGTRYRLEICHENGKRTITRARLVYLAGSLTPIPEGFEIHHIDKDRYNDCWDNLIAVSHLDHLKLHQVGVSDVPF